MGAVFMATDPVTSPTNAFGHLIYGTIIGVFSGIFRVYGSATDSVSYAIITANLLVPVIDEFGIPRPYGLRSGAQEGKKPRPAVPKEAVILGTITLIAGICLSGVYAVTKEPIAKQQLAASLASYQEVCPGADKIEYDEKLSAAVEALDGKVYGSDFGKAYINEAVVGTAGGEVVGYVVSVTSGDGVEGNITLSVGLSADGTVTGIAFTELNETPGMGSLCGEPAFKDQFLNVKTDRFTLNGGDSPIDSVTGATISSRAVVNAINAALDFFRSYQKGGM